MFNIRKLSVFFLISFFAATISFGQDPARFSGQIDEIVKRKTDFTPGKKIVVFTGSSSMRGWKNVQDYFPDVIAINTGFGGSHMSDLLFYYRDVIVRFSPSTVFIYEGDNDLNSGKEPALIAQQAGELVTKIRKELPHTQIVIVSPKPSPSRWKIKEKFLELNRDLKKLAESESHVRLASVWNIMLGSNGRPRPDIFLSDSLHMNKAGYDLWSKVLEKYVK